MSGPGSGAYDGSWIRRARGELHIHKGQKKGKHGNTKGSWKATKEEEGRREGKRKQESKEGKGMVGKEGVGHGESS